MTKTLKRVVLADVHEALGARMVPFAGYAMPVQYPEGTLAEHARVREQVGVFDVSHMGLLRISGQRHREFLNRILSRDLSKLSTGDAAYGLLCRDNGGTVDDLIAYFPDPDFSFLVLNASNKDKDYLYIKELSAQLGFGGLILEPLFDSYSILAVQGPKSFDLLSAMGLVASELPKPFRIFSGLFNKQKIFLSTTGYTGERGVEIFAPNSVTVELWNTLLSKGKAMGCGPIGLGARDTLRLEMGYSLYGHELSEDINPLEAGLSWAVSLTKEFPGRDALAKIQKSNPRKLIALKSAQRQTARAEMRVFEGDRDVGFVTSGSYAPSLQCAVALALVDRASQGPYSVDLRGQKIPFEITKRPFYSPKKET